MNRAVVVRVLVGLFEVAVAVVVVTLAVAALRHAAPVISLGALYLLAVLVLAIRRGMVAAVATGALGVLALNYFFIAPVHRLTIAQSENVVALVVFLVVAVVVARLAATARAQAAAAEDRAALAAAREGEAEMLAAVSTTLLRGDQLTAELDAIAGRVARALGLEGRVRLEFAAAPAQHGDERAVRLPLSAARAWLYLPRDAPVGEDELQRVSRALVSVFDVALDRERLAAQAAEAEAARRGDVAKTAVLHAISHDLRSPLTAIRTAADGLASPAVDAGDRAELVSIVGEEADRLARLIDDLLDLSRVQAGAVNRRPDWCDLRDVVGRAARVGDDRVSIELPEELPFVRADSTQMERVFSNLIANALRFSPAGRIVRVTGGAEGGFVTVRVVDEGPGIPQGRLATIFEPFARGENGGTGLGLAICRGFVEANGGRISVQRNPGGGTAFAVRLPFVLQPAGRT